MTGIDIFILVLLVLGLVRGAYTGAIKQVAQLGGLILAFYLAYRLMMPAGAIAGRARGTGDMGAVVGFILVFVIVQILVFLATRAAEKFLSVLHLSAVNRAVGGALGLLRVAFILSAVFLALRIVSVPARETQQQSIFYKPVSVLVPSTYSFFFGKSDTAPEKAHTEVR